MSNAQKKQRKPGPREPSLAMHNKVKRTPHAKNHDRTYRVAHRELVGLVTMHAGDPWQTLGLSAATPGYDLNPGNPILFPWLSGIASNFERYKFTRVQFDVVSGNSALVGGRITAAFEYDYDDDPPTTPAEVGAMTGAVTSNVWNSLSLRLDVRKLNADPGMRYVSQFTRSGGVEPRLVYGGYLVVAGVSTADATFEIWVDYDVLLAIPQVTKPTVSGTVAARFERTTVGSYNFISCEQPLPIARRGQGLPALSGQWAMAPTALNIATLITGAVDLFLQAPPPNVTPLEYVPGTIIDAAIFDRSGKYLNAASQLGDSFITTSGLPVLGGSWEQLGSTIRYALNLPIPQLKRLIPAAAYIVPYLYSNKFLSANADFTGGARVDL